jgi:hypothetical protein
MTGGRLRFGTPWKRPSNVSSRAPDDPEHRNSAGKPPRNPRREAPVYRTSSEIPDAMRVRNDDKKEAVHAFGTVRNRRLSSGTAILGTGKASELAALNGFTTIDIADGRTTMASRCPGKGFHEPFVTNRS